MRHTLIVVLALVLVLFLILVGPLALLWSLNTLFPTLGIAYSVETWVAAFILIAFIQDNGLKLLSRKKD